MKKMIETKNFKNKKAWKKVKTVDIKKKLEREIEEILDKQINEKNDSKNGSYNAKRNSIFRKDNRN